MNYDANMENVATYLAYENDMSAVQNVKYFTNASAITVSGERGMGQLFETLGLNIIHGNDRKTFDIVFYKLRYLKNPKKAAIILNNWNERFEREKMDIVLSVSENSYLRMAALKINFVGDKTAHKVCEMSTHLLKLYVNMIQKELDAIDR